MSNKIKTTINVKDSLINIDYISLIDLARYKISNNPGDINIKWRNNKGSFDFYCLWKELFNVDFKLEKFCEFKDDSSN